MNLRMLGVAAAAALLLTGCVSAAGAGHHTPGPIPAGGQERVYYIAADEELWDFAPQGRNEITGADFGDAENVFVAPGPTRIGHIYRKSLYHRYTDDTFSERTPAPTGCGEHPRACDDTLGMLGPVIRAVVGDTITVVFRNNTEFPASVHPHGVFYAKDSEGAPYADETSGSDKEDDAVPPGGTHTYRWEVPARAGPGPMDGSSVLWMYHSHADEVADTNAGLVGPIVITARDKADVETATPADVDREVFSYFSVVDENASLHLGRNLAELAEEPREVDPDDEEGFEESNLMHSINGYVYGNGPMPELRVGETVRWYTFTLGTEVDLHTPHWHGNTVIANQMSADMVQLLPGMMMASTMIPDDPGVWLFHCHVNDHIAAGMISRYRVTA
ncbi:multicopper oxidase domain-containing protein [Naasia aerilata]|uniref:Copper oxidase n=1 Tax=Naasia aerilata TaxID=1162966 RepID=A0ABN6XJ10_9MICO|nr:multicopper oxidase domain-containing protein [Naasia aerilata]BDZ44890.1 hypothetical protein GCM10025866_07990 [Naasia aerilata]